MPNITGFEQDTDFSDDPDKVTGKFFYDDGSSTYGQLPADQAAQYKNMSSVPPTSVTSQAESLPGQKPLPIPSDMPDAAAPPAAPTEASPVPVEKPQMDFAPPEPAKPDEGISIPKTARIAYMNNNPGNLKFAGQTGAAQGDAAADGGHWAHFETAEDGYAALAHQVDRDAEKGGTLAQIITRYAPPTSNDTAGYISAAAKQLGVSADTPMTDVDRGKLTAFMAQHESGTRAPGGALVASTPSAGAMGGQQSALPQGMAGMLPAEAEQHGQMLTPEQLHQRQQDVYDKTMNDMAVVQAAARGRIQGRTEYQQAQQLDAENQQKDAQAELVRNQKIQTEAEQNIQREVMQPIQKVDPKRYLRNMSTGDRVLGAIGIMLAGVGAAFDKDKGPNVGIQLMQDAINKDIDAQKDDIANARAQSQNRVQFWSHKLGSAESGVAAARLEAKQAAANMLNAKAIDVENADIKAQVQQASQQILDSGQQEAQQLEDTERNRLALKYAPPKPTKITPDLVYKTALDMKKANASPDQIAAYFKSQGIEPPAGDPAGQKFNRDQARLLAVNEDATAKLQNYAKLRGFYYDDKNDRFVGTGSTNMVVPGALSKQNAEVAQNVDTIAPVIGLVQGGGLKAHAEEIETIKHGLKSGSNNIALAALNQHWAAIRNVMKGVRNYPSGAEQESPEDAAPQ